MDQHGRREYTDQIRLGGAALPVISPARLYVCGITPYDVTHLGHASTFVWADVAAAVLRLAGAETVTCRNVTDVDDVLTPCRRAARSALRRVRAGGRSTCSAGIWRALRVAGRPEHEPRARRRASGASCNWPSALLSTGHAYHRDGCGSTSGAG